MTKQEFAQKIKQKYPAYNDINDDVLADKMLEKYPVYQNQISNEKNIISKISNTSGKILGAGSDFLFGNLIKSAGGVVVGGYESAKELLTGKETQNKKGYSVAPGEKGLPISQAVMAGLESTIGGVGEKLAAKVTSKISAPLIARAEKIYQSALKPTNALIKKSPDVVKTGLKEGIRVSESGLGKLQGIMESIGEDIGKIIDSGVAQGKSVSKNSLLPYLDEMKEYLGSSLGGKEIVKDVNIMAKKIISELPNNIPIKQAQQIKQTTQNLVSKYYNKLAPVEIETKKQLARGLKEEISKAVPEISQLNARDTKLFGLEDALEASLKRIGNKNIISLGDMFALGSGGATAGVPGAGLAVLAKKVLGSPAIKSQLAITLNKINVEALKNARYPVAVVTAKLLDLINQED